MKFRQFGNVALLLLIAGGYALAASTINPGIPAPNSQLASAPIRNNFQASYNDVNNLQKKFNSTISPASPNFFQDWIDTTTPTAPNWKMYVGSTWVSIGSFNCSGSPCTWTPGGTYVTASGTLTAHHVILGAGGTVVTALAGVGTTAQVFIGNASGDPSFGSIDLTTMVGSSILPAANGGTGNAFTLFSGPSGSTKTYILPNSSTTILTTAAGVTNAQLATMATDTFKMNATGGSATPTDVTMPACPDSGGNHLNFASHIVSCGNSGATNGQIWNLTISGTQTLGVSTRALFHANSSTFDPSSICNTSTTWVCTPTVAGYYNVTCELRIDDTNGPPAKSALAEAAIYKNGLGGTQVGVMQNSAQTNLAAASVSGFVMISAIVQVNGSTDTIACSAYSDDAVGPTVQSGRWYGFFVHS